MSDDVDRGFSAGTGDLVAGLGPLSRRRFLGLVGLAGVTAAVGVQTRAALAQAPSIPPDYVAAWPDGVIAGDPRPGESVIWTRLDAPAGGEAVPVTWEVASDDTFTSIVAGGAAIAEGTADWTVKVPVTGLELDSWFAYRFTVGPDASPVGRLRTAPAGGSSTSSLRFAFGADQQQGDMRVSQRAASEEGDLDFFLHLGDYIYVNDGADVTLADYRNRYHSFKGDPQIQRLQSRLPFVAMWDDGEFRNGVDRNEDPARLQAAETAWFENMAVIPPAGDVGKPYRKVGWGDLADLFLIDTRAHRDPELDDSDVGASTAGRTCLGATQKAWLLDGLAASTARWKLIGSPTDFAPWTTGDPDRRGVGGWDDYAAERQEILSFVADHAITDVVFLCGETHVWIAAELHADPEDPDTPLVATCFTTGSQTPDPDLVHDEADPSGTAHFYVNIAAGSLLLNPHQRYLNLINFGYTVVQVDECAVTVEFRTVNVYDVDAQPQTLARFRVAHRALAIETAIEPVPCLSCPDPTETIPWPLASTGLSPVASPADGACPVPQAPVVPVPATPSFTG